MLKFVIYLLHVMFLVILYIIYLCKNENNKTYIHVFFWLTMEYIFSDHILFFFFVTLEKVNAISNKHDVLYFCYFHCVSSTENPIKFHFKICLFFILETAPLSFDSDKFKYKVNKLCFFGLFDLFCCACVCVFRNIKNNTL